MSSTTFIYRVMVPANLAWESSYYIVMRTKNSKSVKQMLNLWSLSWAKLAVWLELPLPNKKKKFIKVLKQANSLHTADMEGGWEKNPRIWKSVCRFWAVVFEEP